MPEFTKDYFTETIPNFEFLISKFGKFNTVLEVGSYQGRSACWMLQNLLSDSGQLTCIDPFVHQDPDPFCCDFPTNGNPEIAKRFWRNIDEFKKTNQTVELMFQRSYPALADLIVKQRFFEFIYIDGNHSSPVVLADAVMCYGLLKPQGIMLFDDYTKISQDIYSGSQHGIDSFCSVFGQHVSVLFKNRQVAIHKIK
jgi:predicted O-methyltransferase YrrM